jgi:basic membrane protein A
VNKTIRIAAGLAVVALTATACGSKPKNNSGGGGGGNASFKACMVTDTGGIDDRSFNAASWAGMQAAQSVAQVSYVQSATQNDYVQNINGLLAKKCGLIVTVGGLMQPATDQAAKANPSQKFVIVDASSQAPNLKGLEFNTAQGAFLAGYLAAAETKTGKVGTWGGMRIAPVTIYMDGFWEGVQYYNKQNSKNVQVLGWNEQNQSGGQFTNSFTDQNGGKQLTQTMQQQGADIVFPVAGGAGLGAAAAAEQSNGQLKVIWVDTDGCVSAQQYCNVFLASAVKGITTAVTSAVEDSAAGKFNDTNYIGTLANGGTGLTLDKGGSVSPAVQTQLNTVKQAIISGSITITSPSQPKP